MALTKLNYTGQGTIPIASIPTITSAKMPAGSVLQTVQAQLAQTQITISSQSFTDTGLNLNIISISANSKFLCTLSSGGWFDLGNGTASMWVTIRRNSSGGSYDYVTNGYGNNYGLLRMSGDGGSYNIKPYSAQILDSPSVLANVTLNYKVVCRVNTHSSAFQASDRGIPTLIVQEIAG